MAIVIRLKRFGTKKRPHSRIVVCKRQSARDGQIIEKIGFYDPSKNPPLIKFDKARAEKWLKSGALPSETVRSIFKREGLL